MQLSLLHHYIRKTIVPKVLVQHFCLKKLNTFFFCIARISTDSDSRYDEWEILDDLNGGSESESVICLYSHKEMLGQ